jgi:hypothetical protein
LLRLTSSWPPCVRIRWSISPVGEGAGEHATGSPLCSSTTGPLLCRPPRAGASGAAPSVGQLRLEHHGRRLTSPRLAAQRR